MFSSVGACTEIMDMLLGGNVSAPVFQTIDSMFDDALLVHTNVLLCVIYCWPFTLQLQPILWLHCQLSPKMMFLHSL